MEPEQEKELLRQLDRIAGYLEKLSAAVTAEVAQRVKDETHGLSEVHDSTQVFLRSMEQVREEALKILRKPFPR